MQVYFIKKIKLQSRNEPDCDNEQILKSIKFQSSKSGNQKLNQLNMKG